VWLVLLIHVAALTAAALLPNKAEPIDTPPTISGVIIQAAPAEVVQAPSSAKPKPIPEKTVEKAPPKPKPKAKPKPKPKPVAPPKPVVPQPKPPAEKAITQPEPEPKPEPLVEQSAPAPAPSVAQATPNNSKGAPVTLPRIDAKHHHNPAPAYPSVSRRRGEEGTVILELLVLADGRVTEISIKQSSGYPRLDRSAIKAVKRWRYTPAKQAGKAIEYRYQQPVKFDLQG
jgi:protein TonB